MKDSAKNRDPERARSRAVADLRCAARKVGIVEARRILAELSLEIGVHQHEYRVAAAPGHPARCQCGAALDMRETRALGLTWRDAQ